MGVTQTKFDEIKSTIITNLGTAISHVAVGSNATAPTAGDTTLNSEDYRDTTFSEDSGASFFSANMFLDTTENNGNTILEVGTFTAGAGGTMYNRALTNSVAKTSSVEMFIELRFVLDLTTS